MVKKMKCEGYKAIAEIIKQKKNANPDMGEMREDIAKDLADSFEKEDKLQKQFKE